MKLLNPLRALAITLLASTAAISLPALSAAFPERDVKIIVPFPVGGGADIVSRLVAQKLQLWWGKSVIVDNRPGANGFVAIDAAKRSPADGYTLLFADAANMSLAPSLFKRLPYDPVKDFDPVTPLFTLHFFVTVPADSPWKSMPDMIAAAKAKKGSVSYASSGVGSIMHLGGAMLETATGVSMMHVPYKELSTAFLDVAKNDVNWGFGSGATTAPMYQSKKVKYLAIAAPQRHPSYPDVPTIAEAGGPPDFELRVWAGLFAPQGTPEPVIEKIHADVSRALREPDVMQRLTALGVSTWQVSTKDVKNTMQADTERFKSVVKRVNISLD